ncbi:MAG: O-antigen ligase family protein [candidate division FCPU426 bacterium]
MFAAADFSAGFFGASGRALFLARRQDRAALAVSLAAGLVWFLGRGSAMADMVLGAAALLLGFMAPCWLPALWVFCLPFEYAREFGGLLTVYTGEMLLLAALPGAAWHWFRQPSWRAQILSALGWFWPFVLVLALSAWLAQAPAAWRGLLRWWEFLLAFLLTLGWLRRSRDAERVFWAMIAAAVISAWTGVAEVAAGAGARPELTRISLAAGDTVRAAAGFGANALAMYLALLLPFSAAAALFHPRPWGRLAGLLACACMTAGFLMTFSLTGWLAVACAAAVLLGWAACEQPRWGLWTTIIALAGAALFIGLKPELLSGPFWEDKLSSWQDRWDYLFVSGRMLATSPWLGIGPGMYRHVAPLWGSGSVNPIGLLTHPHSLWLTVLVETGAAGLAAVGLAVWRYVARMAGYLRRLPAGWPQAAGWALAAGLAGFFAANFTEQGLVHDRGMHAAVAAAAALAWLRRARSRQPERQP